MSALPTPSGGGTTAQTKPAAAKQKFQKLDINSLYCANRNENSEPSSVKSQLSRKHGMQSLGKVPSARRPPANLPSLKTETGQDPNTNCVSVTPTAATTAPATCITQTITTCTSSAAAAAAGPGGWVSLPPPSSPHFRNEFPSLEAAAQPSHRTDHTAAQPSLRPQTEGSWTCGGTAGSSTRPEAASSPAAAPVSTPVAQQTPAFRAILPSFLMKGNNGSGLSGLGTLGSLSQPRESRPGGGAGGAGRERPAPPRAPPTPRAVEVLTARPILREDQISSLDDIARDAGWANHDDIDYDQKLDFSDGEPTAPSKGANKNRASAEHDRADAKGHDGDEEQIWAERRQKQSNEVAQAVARARQRKEEEQRRQLRDAPPKERERYDARDREPDRDRPDPRDKERVDNRDRFDNRDNRDRQDNRDRDRQDSRPRDRVDSDKETRNERDRNDNRERNERDKFDRERSDRDRDRSDRDRMDRDFRDRDYGRDRRDERGRDDRERRDDRDPAFSKTFQANIPPRFLKQQQNRQQDDQHKGWSFTNKPAPRRPEPAPYNAPRHAPANNARRSYSRDYSDREDDFRREKDGSGPQWRSEMQDYERSGRELDRSNSKDSYKDNDYKERRHDSDRKSSDSTTESSRTAADKLSEVFERKSIGLIEPFATPPEPAPTQPPAAERRVTPPSIASRRDSAEKDYGKTSWAEIAQDDQPNYTILKSPAEKVVPPKDEKKEAAQKTELEVKNNAQQSFGGPTSQPAAASDAAPSVPNKAANQNLNSTNSSQTITPTNQSQSSQKPILENPPLLPKLTTTQEISKPIANPSQVQKQPSSEHIPQQPASKPVFTTQKSEKELSETESIASKSSTDPQAASANKVTNKTSMESLIGADRQRGVGDKKHERFGNEQLNRVPSKDPIERKSSGSGSEKKTRGGFGGGYSVYTRGWGPRENRGRRTHRNSRSNRASESDGSTDGALNAERKERRRAPRSPRGPKKQEQRPDDAARPQAVALPTEQGAAVPIAIENREPFAPRGQPSRRGRGGFQGTSRPPAPAKRVAGYGPPNTKSPFSQANRAVKEHDDGKEHAPGDDKNKFGGNKLRRGSSNGRRDRRPKGPGGPLSGEDENWETTSEHSEGGTSRRTGGRKPGQSQRGGRNAGNRQNSRPQGPRKDLPGDAKTVEITEAVGDLKISATKKEDEPVDDGFQEVRNKKAKDARPSKEEVQANAKNPRSHSNQGPVRTGSSSRNTGENPKARGSAPVPGKGSAPPFERPRQGNLAPRFVKQRQKQQMGMVSAFGQDAGAAPPPPAVNAWDKPISQSLRGNVEEPAEVPDLKSAQSSQRSTPAEAPTEIKIAAPATCVMASDKVGLLDGTTPPVETIIFENTNYKTAPPPAEALKQKYQPGANVVKPQLTEDMTSDIDPRALPYNGEVRARPRSIQELIGDNSRSGTDGDNLGLQMSFDTTQKAEDSSDMKLDFAFDSDLGQLTEDKSAKTLGLQRGTHLSTSNTISPLAADLNLKIASVKKVWEMPAVVEGTEELQFSGFEESGTEPGAPPNVCKVKPTQQLQSPPPQHYNHVGYQGGYGGGLSVPSPPAVLFNSSQQLLGSSQQLPQQGGLYGAFLDQSRGQFGGFPGTPYAAGSAPAYNYQPPPDMFQNIPNQYRMAAAAGGGAAFGQSGQLGNSPSTVLISSTSNSLMSATVKPSNQQIGAIGSKGAGVGGVNVGNVNTYQQQYLGYSGPVGEAPYSLPGLLPRPAASSYYPQYQPTAAPAPTYPMQYNPSAQSGAFNSQFLPSQLHVAAAVQQMQQQQYRAPMQQQYAPPQRVPQQLKSPLHEHNNGFAPLDPSSPPAKPKPKPPHSPPHKYHHPPPSHTPHQHQQQQQMQQQQQHMQQQHMQQQQQQQHHQQQMQQQQQQMQPQPHPQQTQQQYFQMMGGGNNGRCGNNGGRNMVGGAPRYPAPIQRPMAPAPPLYRAHTQHPRPHHAPPPRHNVYYHHHQRNGATGAERAPESSEPGAPPADEPVEAPSAADVPTAAEVKAE